MPPVRKHGIHGLDDGRTTRVGRHLPTSGGLGETLRLAREQGLEAVQIFVSNPQGWAVPEVPRPDAEPFVEGSEAAGLLPVVVHAKYLINLASPRPESRERSAWALASEMVAAGSLGAHLVVVHAGSHGGDGESEGIARLAAGLKRARDLAEELAGEWGVAPAEAVVENSVGGGTQLCAGLDALAEVAERAAVRVCLDTAHAFVAGYDLSTLAGAGAVAEEVRERLGERVAVLHLNDAKNPLGSRRDGHARIGEGQVPLESWPAFFGGLPGVPAVMETPYATPEVDAEQVRLVKTLASGTAPGLPLAEREV